MNKQIIPPLFLTLPLFLLITSINKYKLSNENNIIKNTQEIKSIDISNRDTTPPSVISIKANTKSDFVRGEKKLAFEDFSKGSIGDFPEGWYTNGAAEIVSGVGTGGRWLWITRPGVLVPEFTTKYPEEFTFEFDLLHGVPINGGSISISLAEVDDLAKPQNFWTGKNRLTIAFNTANTGTKTGFSTVNFRKNGTGETGNTAYTEVLSDQFNPVHIAIWRQKERVRVYVNQEKVWDLTRALAKEANLNAMVFYTQNAGDKIKHYISNVRLDAVAPVIPVENVVIGKQRWMSKNLDLAFYRNGDPIPQVTDPAAWANLTTGAWCYYNNDSTLGKTYGKLYNWYAVNDPRGLAPKGWRIPGETEWATLEATLGGAAVAGGKMKEAGTLHWLNPNTGADNSSGFTALGGGYRYEDGRFVGKESRGDWASSTKYRNDSTLVVIRSLTSRASLFESGVAGKKNGFSVRCISDDSPVAGTAVIPDTTVISPKKPPKIDSVPVKTKTYDFSKVRICIDKVNDAALPPRTNEVIMPAIPKINPDGTLQATGVIKQGLTGSTAKMWSPGDVIKVGFIANEGSSYVKEQIKKYAKRWEQYANIKFEFKDGWNGAHIKVGLGADNTSWSWLGRDVLVNPLGLQTMNFGWLTDKTPSEEFSRVVLHEFGHALGLVHEHQSPSVSINWDKEKVYAFFAGAPNYWSRTQVDQQVFYRYSQYATNYSQYDTSSIMNYFFPEELTYDNFKFQNVYWLSALDEKYAKLFFPFPPTPQNASGIVRTGDDCDELDFVVEYSAVDKSQVEIILEPGKDHYNRLITWWKRIEIPLMGGAVHGMEMQGGQSTTATIPVSNIDTTRGISFWKAKLLGVHTLLSFKWKVLPAIIGGCRLKLVWRRDTCL